MYEAIRIAHAKVSFIYFPRAASCKDLYSPSISAASVGYEGQPCLSDHLHDSSENVDLSLVFLLVEAKD